MGAELTLSVQEVALSANVAANTSRVRVCLSVTTNSGTWSHDYTTEGYLRLDGAQIASLNGKWADMNATTVLYNAEHTVAHQPDGSKTITVEAGFNLNTTYTGWVYATQPLTLTPIPRASSLSAPAITLGADNTLHISAAAESFTHTVTYTLGSAAGTVCSGAVGGAVTWTPDISLCSQLPVSTSGQGTLTVTTYSGGSAIGSSSVPFTAYVPVSVVPTVTALTVSPVNDNAVLSGWGVAVKGKSKLAYTVTAQGACGSLITGCSFSCAGQSGSGTTGTTGVLASAGTFTPQATVTDSRGRSAAEKGSDITVYDYAVPAISASYVHRCDADGAPDDGGAYLAVQCSASCSDVGGRNSVSVGVRTRLAGGSWSGYTTLRNGAQTVLSGFAPERSYEVELSAVDTVGERKAVVYSVPTEAVAFMLADGGSAAAFGKYPEKAGLDMAWPIHMNNNKVMGLAEPSADGDAATKKYADNLFSSVWDLIYPVGSVYISVNPTSPADLFGGTWEQIQDTFLLAAGKNYPAGSTGGEAEHTLTIEEMPSHTHGLVGFGSWDYSGMDALPYGSAEVWNDSVTSEAAGGGASHNNMPPYLTVYMWKRVDVGGLTVTDDGNGNVTIMAYGSASIMDDGAGNVTIADSGSTVITDDGTGNVTIS